jgi:YbgC/YbaW family acyl-CoA thioester hydrolase
MQEFKTEIRVSWVDTDAAGIVHFSNYFRFFERAEENLLRQIGLSYSLIRSKYGIGIPRVEAHCRYLASLKHDDVIQVNVLIDEVKEKTFKEEFRVTNISGDHPIAEGYIICVAMSFETGRSIPLPAEIAIKLKAIAKS